MRTNQKKRKKNYNILPLNQMNIFQAVTALGGRQKQNGAFVCCLLKVTVTERGKKNKALICHLTGVEHNYNA